MGKTTTLNTAARVMARFGASFDAPDTYTTAYLDVATARPGNFLPKASVRSVVESDDPINELARIAATARDRALSYIVDEGLEGFVPRAFDEPDAAAAGAVVRFAHRYIRGIQSELLAAEHLRANGIHLLTTEQIAQRLDLTGEVATKVERMGIDFMDTDGRTYQVKTGRSPSEFEVDTDYLILVHNDTVKRYRG